MSFNLYPSLDAPAAENRSVVDRPSAARRECWKSFRMSGVSGVFVKNGHMGRRLFPLGPGLEALASELSRMMGGSQ
jgi:hypothetical protein